MIHSSDGHSAGGCFAGIQCSTQPFRHSRLCAKIITNMCQCLSKTFTYCQRIRLFFQAAKFASEYDPFLARSSSSEEAQGKRADFGSSIDVVVVVAVAVVVKVVVVVLVVVLIVFVAVVVVVLEVVVVVV